MTRSFVVASALLALVASAGAQTIVQCKTSGGAQGACANTSIQTAKLVDGATFVTLAGSQTLTNKTLTAPVITGLSVATSSPSGQPLVWPWITATNGSASLASSPYNIASGSYASIGLTLSLPSAGTYFLVADLRTLINASVGTGGFIECQLYNTTDAAAIANSERIGAYEPVINQQYYGPISINEIITVAGAKTIDVQCLRSGATTYTTSAVYSDTNGRSRFSYVKVSP